MNLTEIFGTISPLIALAGYYFYIKDLITNPQKDKSLTAWIIWSIIGIIILKSYLLVGPEGQTKDSKWLLLVYAVLPPIILAILFFYCKSRKASFSNLDKTFLVATILSGIYLLKFQEGIIPLHVNMLVDSSGAFLVAKTVWRDPESESFPAWILFTIAGLTNLGAVQSWHYIHAVYPFLMLTVCASIFTIMLTRRKKTT